MYPSLDRKEKVGLVSEQADLELRLKDDLENVGKGWEPLVRAAYNISILFGAEIIQVKEKFGFLRIYTRDRNPAMESFLGHLENLSGQICEYCGSGEGVIRDGKYWLKSLCPPCHVIKRTREEQTAEEAKAYKKTDKLL